MTSRAMILRTITSRTMTLRTMTLLAGLFAIPATGLAQQGPTFDCAKAESSAEKLICEDADLAALDRRLADRFAAAVDEAEGMDEDAEQTTATLRAMQRGWISGRDECWKEPDLRECVETEYLRREAELVAQFMLEPPSRSVELACGPRVLSVNTFATEWGGVRVEEDGSVHFGAQLAMDTPDTYYLRSAGGLVMEDGAPRVSDVHGEETSCEVR